MKQYSVIAVGLRSGKNVYWKLYWQPLKYFLNKHNWYAKRDKIESENAQLRPGNLES